MATNEDNMDRRVNVPNETLLGAANSAVSGGILALAVSAAVSIATRKEGQGAARLIMNNIKGTHYLPIVATTAAFTALGATVRFLRASRNNEHLGRQESLQEQRMRSFVERVEDSKGETLERKA